MKVQTNITILGGGCGWGCESKKIWIQIKNVWASAEILTKNTVEIGIPGGSLVPRIYSDIPRKCYLSISFSARTFH